MACAMFWLYKVEILQPEWDLCISAPPLFLLLPYISTFISISSAAKTRIKKLRRREEKSEEPNKKPKNGRISKIVLFCSFIWSQRIYKEYLFPTSYN